MSATVVTNRYGLPRGYSHWTFPGKYVPFSGSSSSPSPARVKQGKTQTFTVNAVPADLSTFILVSPNGAFYTFQFVYNGSIPTVGITVPLPAGGASTAAQVQTAIAGVLGLTGGTPVGGSFTSFPWSYTTVSAAVFRINWAQDGTGGGNGGTQATITSSAITAAFFTLVAIAPGASGKRFSWLKGA